VKSKDELASSPSPKPAGAPDCGSCYGAGAPGQCCNSCEEVQALYLQKGWSFDPAIVTQCAKKMMELATNGPKEGCNVYGFVEVPRVAGNIHFAPGRSFQSSEMHVHDLMQFAMQSFNTTHFINAFSFTVGGAVSSCDHSPLSLLHLIAAVWLHILLQEQGAKLFGNVEEQARKTRLLNWVASKNRVGPLLVVITA
jgi:Endoplasmic reticulum vesicle transporter